HETPDRSPSMRIATWNVNSLNARLVRGEQWLERAKPDVLLMQETKLADADVPTLAFTQLGYQRAHRGEGRRNGVPVAGKGGLEDIVTNVGEPRQAAATLEAGEAEPLAEARMIAAICGGVRVASLYVPNGRTVSSTFYQAKLAWLERRS